MRTVLFLICFVFVNFNSNVLRGEEALTIKQQLDRITQNLSDLNKAVFNKSFDSKNLNLNNNEKDVERFTSIDVRMYDLENDIKNLTLQFEEIIFRLDDLSNYIDTIEKELNSNMDELKNNNLAINTNALNKNESNTLEIVKEENTLGELVLTEDNSKITSENEITSLQKEELVQNNELDSLSPDEQLQIALDQITKKKYTNSKITLEKFIEKFQDNQLSGSAHFYLGKIYQLEKNFREAAIVFGEGVQKFPKSIKAAEMYYELSKSLKEMDKRSEACNTLEILSKNYKESKFANDPEKIKKSLECNDEN
tara:strand:- start:7047 stop:7976 length:930 start_codon:yes stop_codon:yes gene_type:complete